MASKPIIDRDRFIRVWESSPTLEAAAKKLNITPRSATGMARRIRAGGGAGATLKRMPNPTHDVRFNAKEFAKVWNSSPNAAVAAERLGITRYAARGRAKRLRDRGVELKQHSGGGVTKREQRRIERKAAKRKATRAA